MSESIDLVVLGRYFDGIASPNERAMVDAWIGTDPGRRAAVAELHVAWLADARRFDAPYAVAAAWNRLSAQLGHNRAPESGRFASVAAHPLAGRPVLHLLPPSPRLPAVARIGLWAAAMIVVAAVGREAWRGHRAASAPPTFQAPAMREYATTRGQRAIVRLLDGTEITLNVDSRLRIPAAFGAERRDVYLDGEAYFRVAHDTAHPFAVHTPRGITRDVGTRFNVRAYRDDPAERIAVTEGAVAVTAVSPQAVSDTAVPTPAPRLAGEVPLRAGQIATVSPVGAVTVARRANVNRDLAWTNGRLEFERMPLGAVVRQLNRWYDLDIPITDPALARRPVTGSYGDEPVAQVLTVITAAVGARYTWRGRTVTIATADRSS